MDAYTIQHTYTHGCMLKEKTYNVSSCLRVYFDLLSAIHCVKEYSVLRLEPYLFEMKLKDEEEGNLFKRRNKKSPTFKRKKYMFKF